MERATPPFSGPTQPPAPPRPISDITRDLVFLITAPKEGETKKEEEKEEEEEEEDG
jgi:hypothetical protein